MANTKELQDRYEALKNEMELFKKNLKESGHRLEKDKIVEIPSTLYFVELAVIGETKDEDSGYYRMYREFIELDNDLLEQVLKISENKNENEAKEFFIKILIDDFSNKLFDKYFDNFFDAIEDIGTWIDDSNEIGYISFGEKYSKELLFEAELRDRRNSWHGYISFITSNIDLTKHNINQEFKKYYRKNHHWIEPKN